MKSLKLDTSVTTDADTMMPKTQTGYKKTENVDMLPMPPYSVTPIPHQRLAERQAASSSLGP
jgi:hypothetical protein